MPALELAQEAQIAEAIQQATAFVIYVGSGGVMNWVEAEVDLALSRALLPDAYVKEGTPLLRPAISTTWLVRIYTDRANLARVAFPLVPCVRLENGVQ